MASFQTKFMIVFALILMEIGALEVDTLEESESFLSSAWTKLKNWWNSSETEWACGSKKIVLSEDVARLFTAAACPSLYDKNDLAATVNRACHRHDLCYESPNSMRAGCDEDFCLALRNMHADDEPNCKIQEIFCFMVKKFGQLVYKQKSAELLSAGSLPL